MSRLISILRAADRGLIYIEVTGVTLALLLMVFLKFTDVVLRNVGKGGVPEFATIAQHLVVWVGMLGASLAAADRKHISIELFAPILTPNGRRVVEGIIDLSTIVFCALAAYISWEWIVFSEQPESSAMFRVPLLDVPFRRWWSLSIIPVGFGLMALRFLKLAIERVFIEEPVDRIAEAEREIAAHDRRLSSDERPAAPPPAPPGMAT
jgi:TRAP-type C4-dicarboxylate transport system permease small subunit